MEKPKCKCGKDIVMLVSGRWICGDCFMKLQEEINKIKREVLDDICG